MRILVRPVSGDRWRKAVDQVPHVYPVAADKISWVVQDELERAGMPSTKR